MTSTPTRYQQAYAASNFPGPMRITTISFQRTDADTLRPGTYQLRLSTITAGINTLSNSDFDGNLGPDNAVFATAALSGPAPDPLTFSGTPFAYNPAHGNLLLDIVIASSAGSHCAYLSRWDASGIFSRYHDAGGTGFHGHGVVTTFEYQATNIPLLGLGALALMALLLAGVGAFVLRLKLA